MSAPSVVVVGQLARDIVLVVDAMPAAGTAADVRGRREVLGGKGANQAVGLAQLGVPVTLVAVAGDDGVGDRVLHQARRDGIDTTYVVRRTGTATALIVEALEADGRWRYLQHLPAEVLLTEADVDAARAALTSADAVLVQLQQPPAACLAAARLGRDAGRLVLLDGAPPAEHRDALLATADVIRADEHETELLTGVPGDDPERVRHAAAYLLAAGPKLAVLAIAGGNLFVWDDSHLLVPLLTCRPHGRPARGDHVVDTTGAGDALVAGLTAALVRGDPPSVAARYAVAASAATVRHPGGRPDLTPATMAACLAEVDAELDRASS